MKTHAKAKHRTAHKSRHAAAPVSQRSHKPAHAHRSPAAKKSNIEIAQEGTGVSRLDEVKVTETEESVTSDIEGAGPDADQSDIPET
jgi:hypothetical protein